MNYSSEQSEIFDWFKFGNGNLVIKARAGTGKTTTIKKAFEFAPEKRILYAVFNKKNAIEAQQKILDPRVEIKTLHSLGLKFIKQIWPKAKPDDEVEGTRLDLVADLSECPLERIQVLRLVAFAKNTFINPSREELDELCEEREIEFFEIDGIDLCQKVLKASLTQDKRDRISFNDMVWLPCALDIVRPCYELVVVDEAQDMSVPQLEMARKASIKRVCVVGDDRQMIYSFRGCHPDGLKMMRDVLNATELTLTTTYRCPKAVVRVAQEIVHAYQAADNSPEGEVLTVENCDNAQIGDAILSRLNAPLMPIALGFLRKNIPAKIEGRDIGKQLLTMVRSQKAKSVENFFEKIDGWIEKQIKRIGDGKNSAKRVESILDIYETLSALAENATSISEIENRINNLFYDFSENSKPAIILSTVHKAKGLEFPTVFILSHTFRKGKTVEEDNIFYVAVTRSKNKLCFVKQ